MGTSAEMEICCVYLAWAGAGPDTLQSFADSLSEHPAGTEHVVMVAWKGYTDAAALDRARVALADIEHEEVTVSPDGLDLSSYRQAAERVSADAICFMNTNSVILGGGWLDMLSSQLSRPGVGLVGATGSYESPLSGPRLPRRLLRAGRYPAFPNPHVRTNAFMLRRELMLELWWPDVSTKGAAWELESGNRSVTRQIEARGLAALVVGRDGEGYPRERWPESGTFRVGDQANLLVADNRTRQFVGASPRFRRKLTRLAWGDPARALPPPVDAALSEDHAPPV